MVSPTGSKPKARDPHDGIPRIFPPLGRARCGSRSSTVALADVDDHAVVLEAVPRATSATNSSIRFASSAGTRRRRGTSRRGARRSSQVRLGLRVDVANRDETVLRGDVVAFAVQPAEEAAGRRAAHGRASGEELRQAARSTRRVARLDCLGTRRGGVRCAARRSPSEVRTWAAWRSGSEDPLLRHAGRPAHGELADGAVDEPRRIVGAVIATAGLSTRTTSSRPIFSPAGAQASPERSRRARLLHLGRDGVVGVILVPGRGEYGNMPHLRQPRRARSRRDGAPEGRRRPRPGSRRSTSKPSSGLTGDGLELAQVRLDGVATGHRFRTASSPDWRGTCRCDRRRASRGARRRGRHRRG